MPRSPAIAPYLSELLAAPGSRVPESFHSPLRVATYNVHRWTGVRGGRAFRPDRVLDVLDELEADVLGLQEVLRPATGPDPIRQAAERLGYHLAFVVTRQHRAGELGNAVLSRWPLAGAQAINLTFGRLERRAALSVRVQSEALSLTVTVTHLSLVDRMRARQVRALLEHPQLASGPTLLMGDMNAWRPTSASRDLDDAFTDQHHNLDWPTSYPSVRPVLALDRLYARGARVLSLDTHVSDAARRASDHLPVIATVALDGE